MYPSLIITKKPSGDAAGSSSFTQYLITIDPLVHDALAINHQLLSEHPQIVAFVDNNTHYFSKDIFGNSVLRIYHNNPFVLHNH